MGDGFRGVQAEQDGRFKSQEKKIFAKMKFPPQFTTKVDMRKVSFLHPCACLPPSFLPAWIEEGRGREQVHIEVLRPWITKKVTQYCGFEDDIVINMAIAELEKVAPV